MKRFVIVLFLLNAFFDSFSQLDDQDKPSLRMMFYDSITGQKTVLDGTLSYEAKGKLSIESDPNDIRSEVYTTQLLIEVIHARGALVLNTVPVTGLREFAQLDVLKVIKPALQRGDRIVITYRMLSEAEPSAYIIKVI